MSDTVIFKLAPSLTAPTKRINRVVPKVPAELVKCECHLNIGVFFDGTYNNYENDIAKLEQSNIARLFESYRNEPKRGFFKIYVPGVGTTFRQINEFGKSKSGGGFGIGCEARVLFGLLSLLNTIHRTAFEGQMLFNDEQIRVLCSIRNGGDGSHGDYAELRKFGLNSGLLIPDFFGEGNRQDFFRDQTQRLESKISAEGKTVIKEIFLDIFGFSRGAAEARVFCNWLERLLIDQKIAGISVRFRFVGIFDTVAAGGFWSGVNSAVTNTPDGHSGWASVEYLRLPRILENCVHMVAMHELRRNFPLDTAGIDGKLPPNTQEIVYPGTHSDVGGGYAPGELGCFIGGNFVEGDSLKLSQIPLNHMFECAVSAGAPMEKNCAIVKLVYAPLENRVRRDAAVNNPSQLDKKTISLIFDSFALSPSLINAYNAFITASSLNPRELNEWMQPYLNWRWQKRFRYEELLHVYRANEKDKKILRKFNLMLIKDAELIERVSRKNKVLSSVVFIGNDTLERADRIAFSLLDKEAKYILEIAKKSPNVPAPIQFLFDNFLHDSLAGFNSKALEPAGYWRYRKGFLGSAKGGIVMREDNNYEAKLS